MKGGDPDSPPPFKVVQSLRPIGGFGRGLIAKLALRLLRGVGVTKSQPIGQLAATIIRCPSRHSVAFEHLSSADLLWLALMYLHRRRKDIMKALASILTLSLVLAFSGSAFAATTTHKTKSSCEKAGMHWDATAKKCS
jgi:hypothetical protein